MSFLIVNKHHDPLKITFRHQGNIVNQPVLFVWEDSISKNVKHTDYLLFNSNIEYYSSLNKPLNFFENGITFKIVSAVNYEVMFFEEFKNLNFLRGNNILYVSQNGYTGYSYAARNYIYQLLKSGYNVQWDTRFQTKNSYVCNTVEEKLVHECTRNKIDYDSVIIHHTPESWFPTMAALKNKRYVYGLSTWETTRLHDHWVHQMNNSVDEIIVPSRFNVHTFKQSGINKKINLWRHDIFPFSDNDVDTDGLFSKFELYDDGKFISDKIKIKHIIENNTVYYNISQYTARKNIDQLLSVFSKRFDQNDNVCLLIKTNLENFDEKDAHTLRYKIHSVLKYQEKQPHIICCFDTLSDDQITSIHRFGDVYFTLNRGEGFGLCTYTAKKIGNKVICGSFGAEQEFLDDNDILLKYELNHTRYLDDFNKYYIDDKQKCAYFDTEQVVRSLRHFPKTIKQKQNYA